jgi:hypothetical protein
MCKFEGNRCMAYKTVVSALLRYERAAPAVIASRWLQEKEMLSTLRRNEANELMRDSYTTAIYG